MSPKCEVPLLNQISMSIVAKQLVDVLAALETDDDVALTFVVIKSYFENLGVTGDIYQDLLNLIMNSEYLEPTARYFALKLLLQDNVKMLATGIFPEGFYERIIATVIDQGTNLTALNLKGIWIKDEQLHMFYDLIKSLQHLNVLNIPCIANDEALKFIGEFSENLKMLDVSGETDITEIGIDALCRGCPSIRESLTVVNIGMYGEENVCHTDVAMLIANLPNLVNLGSYSFVGKSIHHIVQSKKYPDNIQSKLQYIHDTNTSKETARSIVKVCPLLETIYLQKPELGVISMIEKVENLHRLKLNKFPCHEFHQLIERCGSRINSIMLSQATGPLNLTHVADKCSSLVSIELYKMETLTHEEEIPFTRLEDVEVLHCNIRTSTFKYLMTCAPNLRKMIVGDEIKLNDVDMARFVNKFK